MPNVRPRLVELIVCDDVRREVDNKSSWIGVYPGRVIIVDKFPATFPKLCFVYLLAEGYGTFAVRHRLLGPEGEEVFISEEGELRIPSEQLSVSLSITCAPVRFESQGTYLAQLVMDDAPDSALEIGIYVVQQPGEQ